MTPSSLSRIQEGVAAAFSWTDFFKTLMLFFFIPVSLMIWAYRFVRKGGDATLYFVPAYAVRPLHGASMRTSLTLSVL